MDADGNTWSQGISKHYIDVVTPRELGPRTLLD